MVVVEVLVEIKSAMHTKKANVIVVQTADLVMAKEEEVEVILFVLHNIAVY